MARNIRVAIIGAGIGGLAAAGALRQHGFEVVVYERASALGEVGAGIQLGPNAVKVLRALGIEQALRPLASEPANYVSLAWNDAHLRYREPVKAIYETQFGAPYLMVHRADLHRLLCERLPPNSIRLDACCTGVTCTAGPAVANFADGITDRGRRCRRRRRHQLDRPRKPVRRPAGALHAADGVALHRADRACADPGRDQPQ